MRGLLLGLPLLASCVIGDATEGSPVRFEASSPVATGFAPGRVIHEVCVAVDTDDGFVTPLAITSNPAGDGIGPAEGAAVQRMPLQGLDCLPASEGWTGWARLAWHTGPGRAVVVLEHASAPSPSSDLGGDTLEAAPVPTASAGELVLEGTRFEGYDVVVGEPELGASYVRLPVDVAYRGAGALAGGPAGGITLSLSFLPAGPEVFGSSTGTTDPIVTDVEGHVDVFLLGETIPCEDVAVFVTPAGGGTALAATITCPF